ncbi:MAG TPA: hypothetical protein DEB39_13095 [Planctomycetaceae bacterium]|nr:hypothetical protein [Planctomycetaceae bacterium]
MAFLLQKKNDVKVTSKTSKPPPTGRGAILTKFPPQVKEFFVTCYTSNGPKMRRVFPARTIACRSNKTLNLVFQKRLWRVSAASRQDQMSVCIAFPAYPVLCKTPVTALCFVPGVCPGPVIRVAAPVVRA